MVGNHFAVFVVVVGLSSAGCLGDPSQGGGGQSPSDGERDAGGVEETDPRALFARVVGPVLVAQCSAAGCHAPPGSFPLKFLASVGGDHYATVTGYVDEVVGGFDKTRAPMLHRIDPGPHYAAVYSPSEVQAIGRWLDLELTARGAGAGGGSGALGTVAKELMREWSGCMTLEDWNAEGVAVAWAQRRSSSGPCNRCHDNGLGSFVATDTGDRLFESLTTYRDFMIRYFAPVVTGVAEPKMLINADLQARVGAGEGVYRDHPRYEVNDDATARLERFYDKTLARKVAGTCGTPRMRDL